MTKHKGGVRKSLLYLPRFCRMCQRRIVNVTHKIFLHTSRNKRSLGKKLKFGEEGTLGQAANLRTNWASKAFHVDALAKRLGNYSLVPKVLILITPLLLTGCYDKIELEDRAFIGAIAIDAGTDSAKPFLVGTETLTMKDDENKSGSRNVQKQAGESVTQALRYMNDHSSKNMNLGLAKACVLDIELFADESLLREAVDALERNAEVSNRLFILAAEGATELLEGEIGDETSLGVFVYKFYKNNDGFETSAAKLDLEGLAASLRGDGCAIVPLIEAEDGALRISGGLAITEGVMAGRLTEEELRGLVWVNGRARGVRVNLEMDGTFVPLTVSKSSASVRFYEDDGLVCETSVRAEGMIEEFGSCRAVEIEDLEQRFAYRIAEEIQKTFNALADLNADGYQLVERLRKRYPSLYDIYSHSLRAKPGSITFISEASVRISNVGSLVKP